MTEKPRHITKPLYLNANIIYSEAVMRLKVKRGGTIAKLKEKYALMTSILTRFEVIQNLRLNRSLNVHQARRVYLSIIYDFKITELTSLNKMDLLTDEFIDKLAGTNLSFKDALHLIIAKKRDLIVCAHDKKMSGNRSQHRDKQQFYGLVSKPEELISPRAT